MPDFDATAYYAQRATQYDALYNKPERQPDLAQLGEHLKTAVSGRCVLEIACGTGYWTEIMAQTAQNIHATDINEPMLDIARQRQYPRHNVSFETIDMYELQPGGHFNALFGGFIWSHISLEILADWLDHLHRLLQPSSCVLFADNRFVPGSNTPIAMKDAHGNTYQTRKLENGKEYSIIKNFPEPTDIALLLKTRGQQVQIQHLEYYWLLQYQLA